MRFLILLSALGFAQAGADDFQKRVRIEGQKVFVDDAALYEGPWQKADVTVVDFTGRKAKQTFGEFEPWKVILLKIDGEERLRLPVRSLARPVAWPPMKLEEVKPQLKRMTETANGKKTFVVMVSTEKADFEIYRGPVYETRVERTAASFTVFLNDEALYRITRATRPLPRVEDVVMAVNLHRVKAGVEPARLVAGLSRGCDLHALYLTKNDPRGLSGHEEDPRGVGYTEEGARAGKRSVISPFPAHETPVDAVESLMSTFYHRVALLHPAVGEMGVGWAHRKEGLGFLVIDVGSQSLKPDSKVYPIVYPVNGQTDVPLDFALGGRETPNPIPDEGVIAGYPITIQTPEKRGPIRAPDAEAQLFTGGTEVPCWLSTPDNPARKDWPQPGAILLLPKEKFKPSTTYRVQFRDKVLGLEKEWSFTTRP